MLVPRVCTCGLKGPTNVGPRTHIFASLTLYFRPSAQIIALFLCQIPHYPYFCGVIPLSHHISALSRGGDDEVADSGPHYLLEYNEALCSSCELKPEKFQAWQETIMASTYSMDYSRFSHVMFSQDLS